jgi:WD40 repeat protein
MSIFRKESKLYYVYDLLQTSCGSVTLSTDGTFLLGCDLKEIDIGKICLQTGQVSSLTGISDSNVKFDYAKSATFSPNGKYVLVCDCYNHCIRKICMKFGNMSTFAGIPSESGFENGPKKLATFNEPTSITFSPDGKYVLVCDSYNHCIRQICLENSDVSTFVGITEYEGFNNGPIQWSIFRHPISLTFSPCNTYILLCDFGNYCIRKICLKSKQVSTFAGNPNECGSRNGPKEQATFQEMKNLSFSPDGSFLLVCDTWNHCIRRICLKSGQVSTFAGIPKQKGSRNGPKEQALFDCPESCIFSKCGKFIIICDKNNIKYIRIKK